MSELICYAEVLDMNLNKITIPIVFGMANAISLENFTNANPLINFIYTNEYFITRSRLFKLKTPINEDTAPYIRYFDIRRFTYTYINRNMYTTELIEKYKLDLNKINNLENTLGKEIDDIYDDFRNQRISTSGFDKPNFIKDRIKSLLG